MITELKTSHCGLSLTDTMAKITARMDATDRGSGETEFVHELTLIAVQRSLQKAGYKKD